MITLHIELIDTTAVPLVMFLNSAKSREGALLAFECLCEKLGRLFEPTPEVRESAGLAFSTLYKSAGLQAIDEIVRTLLHALEDDAMSDTALDGLKTNFECQDNNCVAAYSAKTRAAPSFCFQCPRLGNIDLERASGSNNNELPCYTAENPFYVRLIRNAKRREEVQLQSSKKRLKTPIAKGHAKGKESRVDVYSPPSGLSPSTSISAKLNSKSRKAGKGSGVRCSPKRKRRRRYGILEVVL